MKIKGLISIILGIVILIIKGMTTTMDENGIIYEHIILIPIGFLFILVGIILFLFGSIKKR